MKRLLFVLVFFWYSFANADTKWTSELRLLTTDRAQRPTFTLTTYVDHRISNTWGVFGWALVGEAWSEGYAGVLFIPKPWIEIGLGAGLEQDKNLYRLGASLWLGNDRVSSLTLVEYGGSGWWYQSTVLVSLAKVLKIGGMIQRGVGMGPRVDMQFPEIPLSVYAVFFFYSSEENRIKTDQFLFALTYKWK